MAEFTGVNCPMYEYVYLFRLALFVSSAILRQDVNGECNLSGISCVLYIVFRPFRPVYIFHFSLYSSNTR